MSLASHLEKDLRLVFRDAKGLLIALLLPAVIISFYSLLNLRDIARSGRDPDALILVLSTAFPVVLVASGSLVSERRAGTFQRLARTPANIYALVMSKTISAFLLLGLQVGVILLVGSLVLGAKMLDAPVGLAVVLLATGFAAHALGTALSAAVSTETQASQITALLLLLMLTLSGFLQPLDQLGTVGLVASYAPVARGYTGVAEVLGGAAYSFDALVLVAIGAVMLLVAGIVSWLRT